MLPLVPLLAAVLVVLDDGEVVRGRDAHREGDRIAISLGKGERVLVPARRVVEVRPLPETEGKTQEESGVVATPPVQLAGPPVEPASPREQTAAIGEPSRFATEPVRRRPWPRSEWPSDPRKGNNFAPSVWADTALDPRWSPTSGLRGALPPARAAWARSPISPEWELPDAWRARRTTFGTSALPASAPRDAVDACSRRIAGSGEGARVALLEGRPWEALPIPLYEVELRNGGRIHRTVFSVEGGVCRPLAGNVPATQDATFGSENSIRGYNRALTAAARPLPLGEPIARALALATLADPAAMGPARERLLLLGAPADLDRLAASEPLGCELTPRARRLVHTLARPSVIPPRVGAADDDQVVTFWTWSPLGGVLARHVVRVDASGSVTLDTEEVAHHLGDHRDRPS